VPAPDFSPEEWVSTRVNARLDKFRAFSPGENGRSEGAEELKGAGSIRRANWKDEEVAALTFQWAPKSVMTFPSGGHKLLFGISKTPSSRPEAAHLPP
jgi:hypothetical protein